MKKIILTSSLVRYIRKYILILKSKNFLSIFKRIFDNYQQVRWQNKYVSRISI